MSQFRALLDGLLQLLKLYSKIEAEKLLWHVRYAALLGYQSPQSFGNDQRTDTIMMSKQFGD